MQRFATYDRYIDGVLYEGAILADVTIEETLSDTYFGTRKPSDLSVRIALGPNRARQALFSTANRGVGMRVYGTEGDVKTLLWDGVLSAMELGDNDLIFNGTPHPISVLESLVPMESALLTTTFATDRGFTGTTTDAGSYVAYVVGNVPRVRGFLVNRDLLNNLYDYAFATGAHQILNTYRSIKSESQVGAQVAMVTSSEYTVSTTLYPGFTVARFVVDQIDTGGALYTLYADLAPLAGAEAERLPSRMIRSVLEGYGQTCVAASFAAADDLYAQLDLGLDFAQQSQVSLLNLFRDGLLLLDGILTKTSAGWTLALDQRPTTIQYQLQEGPAADVPTVVSISPRRINPLDNATKNVIVKCTPDLLSDSDDSRFLVSAQRTVSTDPNASDLPIELSQVRQWAIADWLADRKYRQILARTETLQVTAPHLAAAQLRDLVQVTSPRRNLTAAVWQVTSLSRSPMGQPVYNLEPWSPDWYVYEPGTQPNDPILGTFYDFSRTVPPAIIDITFPSGATFRGTEIVQGGAIRAFVTIRYTTPTSGNFAYALPRYRPNTSTIWIPAGGPIYQTGSVDVKIRGLNPGVAYEYSVQAVNAWGLTAGG